MSRLLIIYSLFLLPLISSVQAQSTYGFEGRFKAGFLVGHRAVMGHLVTQHSYAGEVSYVFRTNGQRNWHGAYKYPEIGVTLYAGSIGNPEVLGNFFGGYSFITFPFIARKNFRFNGKLGCGLGLGTKHYDEVTNPKNVAISTPLNAMICLGIDARYYMGNNWLSLGIDMTHFSNGAYKVPNIGLNLPYLSFGYGHYVRHAENIQEEPGGWHMPYRKIIPGFTGIISAKEVFPTSGKRYPVYALSIHARTFLKPRVGWELAFDVISKQAILAYRPEVPKTQMEMVQMGAFLGYLLPLDRFHFVLGMGYYLKDRFQPEDAFYHRVGIRYYLDNGINFNLVLKSHWARADYIEWGIGYSFNTKKHRHE